MSERRFGVEIECGHPDGHNAVSRLLSRTRGLPAAWSRNIGLDGSGVEVRSPILRGKEGFKQLEEVFHVIVENGGFVTTSDGLHVHHDAPDFMGRTNFVNVVRLVESWATNQELIDRFVDPIRRNRRGACPKDWNDRTVNILKETIEASGGAISLQTFRNVTGGRGALNVNALREHGTIEIRQHEGTLHFPTAKSWIIFGQYFLDSVVKRKKPMKYAEHPAVLLKRIRVPKDAFDSLNLRAERGLRISAIDPVFGRSSAEVPHLQHTTTNDLPF